MSQAGQDRRPAQGSRHPAKSVVAVALAYQWFYNGANYLAFKVSVDAMPPFLISALRFSVAAALLSPLAVWRLRRTGRPPWRQLAAASAIGVIMLVLSQAVSMWGISYIPAGVASVFGSSSPLFLALFAWVLLREPLGRRQLAGVGLGFAGLALMAWGSAGHGDLKVIGVVAVLAAAAAWAGGSLLDARLTRPDDATVGLFTQLLVAGAVLWCISLGTGELSRVDLPRVPRHVWAALAFLIVASTLVGYAAFLWLNRTVSTATANTFFYVAPVIAMTLAAIFLGEPLTAIKIVASVAALAGVALMVTGGREPAAVAGQRP